METDYSLQFRLIRQHEHESTKYLKVSVSSTYGCALALINYEWRLKGDDYTAIKDVWTDVLEGFDYENFDDFRLSSNNYIYNEYIGTGNKTVKPVALGDNSHGKKFVIKHNYDGRVVVVLKSFSKIDFYGAALMAPNAGRRCGVRPIHGLKLSNSSATIKMFEWNPKNSAMFVVALAKTLYTVVFYLKKQSSRILAKMDMKTPMTAVSWNPDGTQLTVGDAEGRIYQFTPQLRLIRTVNPPRLIPSVFKDKFVCSGLCWVSKTERIVVFTSETSDKLHLTKLTVKPNKPPKWTVWDVLPVAESAEHGKTFTFLPVFKWNTVLMHSPCLSEVYTFGVVNKVWKPLKLDERFTIKTPIEQIFKPYELHYKVHRRCRRDGNPTLEAIVPTSADLHKFKKTFITSMSINYSSQRSVITSQCPTMQPQPVIYVTTSNGMLFIYQMISLYSDRPSLARPAEMVDKNHRKNGPYKLGYNVYYKSSTDSDESSCNDSVYWPETPKPHRRQKKRTSTVKYEKDAESQANFSDASLAIMKLRKEIIRLRENDIQAKKALANISYLRLREAGKLSAYGVLEVYAAENENFNKIRDTKERWTAMYHGDAKLIAEMKRLHCKLTADEFVAAVLSILSKPVARIMNLDTDGLVVKGSDFLRVENAVLEVVCGVMLVKFMIV
uniref:ANAPC4_WD40 domain-containing protein n=1 Tax=Panagrellus redivivus TaxID=6233 RepID=A0A7E4VRI6_PANRE